MGRCYDRVGRFSNNGQWGSDSMEEGVGVRAASTFPVDTQVDVTSFSKLASAAGGAGMEERVIGLGPLKNWHKRDGHWWLDPGV